MSEWMLLDGSAYRKFLQMVEMQSDSPEAARVALERPAAFHKPTAMRVLKAESAGYLAGMDCRQVGWAVQRLGAGRAKPGDPVSAHAGIEMHAKIGDRVEVSQPLVTLFSEDAALLNEPEEITKARLVLARASQIVLRNGLSLLGITAPERM